MSNNPHSAYVESGILSASPIKLVCLLYEGALASVRSARAFLKAEQIVQRSTSITRALEILAELSSSLDHEKGGELSARLAALYDYMQRRLIQANFEQSDAPLAEVIELLETLLPGWKQIEPGVGAQPRTVGTWPAVVADRPVSGYALNVAV